MAHRRIGAGNRVEVDARLGERSVRFPKAVIFLRSLVSQIHAHTCARADDQRFGRFDQAGGAVGNVTRVAFSPKFFTTGPDEAAVPYLDYRVSQFQPK